MPFFIRGVKVCPIKTYLMKNVYSIRGCREQGDGLNAPFGVLTAKCRLLHETIRNVEMKVNKAERTVGCNCLLHNIIIDLEGTALDHSVLQKTQVGPIQHGRQPQR